MRAIFCIFFLCLAIFGADFITRMEYARMLYLNPRGIGCDKCHGANGEGGVISRFKYFNKKTKQIVDDELTAPRINNVDFDKFKKAISEPKSIMPSYFLTDEESGVLYEYIVSLDKQNKNSKNKKIKNKKGEK
ncbi:cytochrome C oxidase subunit III [Campylobacter sp. faydin G-24]|uniref:Cytochrome C oxidase subunit III n=1 Tax=Campylobacter anatolicus TaxID=2829105 RepID=A0ABS5HJC0_9BACT|nr:c-type cytochrome [Campylobacter anatolicus]MBR8461967.1 cytochrome C oxidase subunit III [Campylobacter anatolicus]MBR8464364.1 cytochrome C oxidase subunit III [Campylobacter anatolicus]MBR8464944.1 cytochrome C oxidase subunit III [Campylobacter anatolicus]